MTKHERIILNIRQKDIQWSGIIRTAKNKIQDKYFSQKGHDDCLWDNKGVILMDVMLRGTTINSQAHIRALTKMNRRFRRVRPHENPVELLLLHTMRSGHTLCNQYTGLICTQAATL